MENSKRITGSYETTTVAGEKALSFIPYPLPPSNPKLTLDGPDKELLLRAEQSLAALEIAGEMVPSLEWFIYAFVRKEAVTSAQIEGTQATLMDLLIFEADEHTTMTNEADVEEVCNYLEALKFARREIRQDKGLPISLRLLNETHKRLMRGVRGGNKQPGEIRQSQNWIGGTRPGNATFVPPPPHMLGKIISAFEKYIHTHDDLSPLIRIGLLHVQFETIHPYLDGNGRLGRLLIILLLEHWGLLKQPLLYLSLFFKRNRSDYYHLLGRVRTEGDWEAWIIFFLEGVTTIANEAVLLARELFALVSKNRGKILSASETTLYALRLFEVLPLHPIVTMTSVIKLLGVTKPTAIKTITTLEKQGILLESSGRKRDRTFEYRAYLDLLLAGTELNPEREN